MRGYEEMVREFHAKYNHWDYRVQGEPPCAVKLLRLRLIAEELGELAEVCDSEDPTSSRSRMVPGT